MSAWLFLSSNDWHQLGARDVEWEDKRAKNVGIGFYPTPSWARN
jgi:hypothetical protein